MKAPSFIMLLIILFVSACSGHKETPGVGQLNVEASLPERFDFEKMGLKVITSMVNKQSGTMSILYGNDSAKATLLSEKGICLPGTILALVTWKQQPDKRWIGGNIPGKLVSVEILKSSKDQKQGVETYSRFTGAELKADPDSTGQQQRIKMILGLKSSIMF